MDFPRIFSQSCLLGRSVGNVLMCCGGDVDPHKFACANRKIISRTATLLFGRRRAGRRYIDLFYDQFYYLQMLEYCKHTISICHTAT